MEEYSLFSEECPIDNFLFWFGKFNCSTNKQYNNEKKLVLEKNDEAKRKVGQSNDDGE